MSIKKCATQTEEESNISEYLLATSNPTSNFEGLKHGSKKPNRSSMLVGPCQ